MIGVIGVAPPEPVPATLGGPHGGNMDTRLIGAGAIVYLPVFHPGAQLFLGDVHAAQGDGEVFLTGVEIAAEIEATIGLLKQHWLPGPLVETAEVVATVAQAPTLDEASTKALRMARELLVRVTHHDPIDVGFLMSAACDLRVSQFLPGATIHARVEVPKSVLRANGYSPDPAAW
jgi:amidase